MSKGIESIVAVAIVAVAAAGGGYWLGQRGGAAPAVSATQVAAPTGAPAEQRKPLYYRNPMGLPDTSPTPKKDPMGMDYIPVFAGEDGTSSTVPGQISISTEKVQKLGVKLETVGVRGLARTVRAAGRIEPDERRLTTIAPKFEGYVERLHVNVTGQPVGRGQPLFEVYSPELVSAQREYALAAQGVASLADAGGEAQRGMRQLADASLARLKNWDISAEQIQALAQSGETRRTLTFRSPTAGIVTEKKAVQGMRFMPGEALYQVADLSAVWVVADVFEQDLGQVKSGARATVRINAYPDKTFAGTVTYVYPTLKAETRTVPVRIELPNPGQLLKPGMFAQVELPAPDKAAVIAVPLSAVIDSGTRSIVLIQSGAGRFEPRAVKLGMRGDDYVEVLDGVREGEQVVVAANFLIDAESNLKAAIGGFAAPATPAAPPASTAGAGHRAEGKLEAVDASNGIVTIAHGPVASLKWPAMTMDFALANAAVLGDLKPGAPVAFDFVERKPGEWVIVKFARAAHAGH